MLYVITTTSLDPIPKSQLLVNKLKINIVHEFIFFEKAKMEYIN
jgi:hypothetical protein